MHFDTRVLFVSFTFHSTIFLCLESSVIGFSHERKNTAILTNKQIWAPNR